MVWPKLCFGLLLNCNLDILEDNSQGQVAPDEPPLHHLKAVHLDFLWVNLSGLRLLWASWGIELKKGIKEGNWSKMAPRDGTSPLMSWAGRPCWTTRMYVLSLGRLFMVSSDFQKLPSLWDLGLSPYLFSYDFWSPVVKSQHPDEPTFMSWMFTLHLLLSWLLWQSTRETFSGRKGLSWRRVWREVLGKARQQECQAGWSHHIDSQGRGEWSLAIKPQDLLLRTHFLQEGSTSGRFHDLPKLDHQLQTKHSNIRACGEHFTFRPQQPCW